jgi:hypothetical protein
MVLYVYVYKKSGQRVDAGNSSRICNQLSVCLREKGEWVSDSDTHNRSAYISANLFVSWTNM